MITTVYRVDDREVEQALDNLINLLSPQGMTAFLGSSVGPYLARRAKDRFTTEGDDVTGPWAPLKEATVAIRESQGYGGAHPINRRTGELEEWVTGGNGFAYPTGVGASLRFPKESPSGELKKKVQHAQKGDDKRTVARPVLGVNEADLLFVTSALVAGVEVAIR